MRFRPLVNNCVITYNESYGFLLDMDRDFLSEIHIFTDAKYIKIENPVRQS